MSHRAQRIFGISDAILNMTFLDCQTQCTRNHGSHRQSRTLTMMVFRNVGGQKSFGWRLMDGWILTAVNGHQLSSIINQFIKYHPYDLFDISSTINHQSSIINHQSSISSILNHKPAIVNHQSLIINHQSLIINHQSSIINHKPSIVNHQSFIINHRSLITTHQPSIINYQSSIINHQPSIINHQSSIINHQPSTINHHHHPQN